MQTLVLVNNNGRFTEQALPEQAQWYPVYAIAVTDSKSIITGGNQSYSRIKFGAYGSGRGDIFVNEGNLKFERVPPVSSGLNIRGDIRNAVIAGKKLVVGINNQQPLVYNLQQ